MKAIGPRICGHRRSGVHTVITLVAHLGNTGLCPTCICTWSTEAGEEYSLDTYFGGLSWWDNVIFSVFFHPRTKCMILDTSISSEELLVYLTL